MKKPSNEELPFSSDYGWSLAGHGFACRDDPGEPGRVISGWEITIMKSGEGSGDVVPSPDNDSVIGKISFTVVNQAAALNRGESLDDVYDSEDDLHCDYYEHIQDNDDYDELLDADRAILLTDDVLKAFDPIHWFNLLRLIEEIFYDTIVAVWCSDLNGEVGRYLGTMLSKLPSLPADKPSSGWLYHDSKYKWLVIPEDRAS